MGLRCIPPVLGIAIVVTSLSGSRILRPRAHHHLQNESRYATDHLSKSRAAPARFQKDPAAGLTLFVLVLGFGEGHLIHGGNSSYALLIGQECPLHRGKSIAVRRLAHQMPTKTLEERWLRCRCRE